MLNKVSLIGRLSKDPDLVYINLLNRKVLNFVLVTSSFHNKGSGEKIEQSEWHNLTFYNEDSAIRANQMLKKGDLVYIEGTIRSKQLIHNKQKQKFVYISVLEFTLLSKFIKK